MNPSHKLLISSSLAAAGLFGLQGSAMALTTMNANVCQIVDVTTPGPTVLRQGSGITNFAASYRNVHCPIIRTAAATAAGYSVFVDGNLLAGPPLVCELDSYNYDGRFLGLASLFIDTVGNFDRLMTLPQSQVPTFSHQVLSCAMPHGASLFDIEPTTP